MPAGTEALSLQRSVKIMTTMPHAQLTRQQRTPPRKMSFFLPPLLTTIIAAIALRGSVTAAALSTVVLMANSLAFTCTVLGPPPGGATRNVLLLHGFPMDRSWFDPLLLSWDDADGPAPSTSAVACDLRGYSPGASPDSVNAYRYQMLASDVFALARAANFSEFHLIGHDHGAILGWVAASQSGGEVLSYTSMSVPHLDLLSAALCGDETDEAQVMASNYFNHWALLDSATVNDGALTALWTALGFELSPEVFQKQLWWYNATMPLHVALPRVLNDSEVSPEAFLVAATRVAIPMEPRPCVPQIQPIGAIKSVPVLLVCGANDPYLLCTRSYATPGDDLVSNYSLYTAESCGHDFFLEGDCEDGTEGQRVMDAITEFIDHATTNQEPKPEPDTTSARSSSRGRCQAGESVSATVLLAFFSISALTFQFLA